MAVIKGIFLFILSFNVLGCVHDEDYKPPVLPVGEKFISTLDISLLQKLSTTTVQKLEEGIVEGYVVSSDNGGNIYKNLYIVSEDGKYGLQISINQSGLYNLYPVGRKVYVKLEGLALVKQYGMTTLGLMPTGKYPIDQIHPGKLKEHVILGKEQKEVEELAVKMNFSGQLLTVKDIQNEAYLNTLVEVNDIIFSDSGNTFIINNSNTDNEVNDSDPEKFIVRVSKYAGFGGMKKPLGSGKLRGILTKYNTTYQLLLRDSNDILFPVTILVFQETFNQTLANGEGITSSPWPKINEISSFDNSQTMYTDPYNMADIRRSTIFNLSVWFPKGKNASLVMYNVNTWDYKNLILSFKLNANIFKNTDKAFTHDLTVKCNDIKVPLPEHELNVENNKNKYYIINIPIPDRTSKIEFLGTAVKNKTGLRIDDIQIIKIL